MSRTEVSTHYPSLFTVLWVPSVPTCHILQLGGPCLRICNVRRTSEYVSTNQESLQFYRCVQHSCFDMFQRHPIDPIYPSASCASCFLLASQVPPLKNEVQGTKGNQRALTNGGGRTVNASYPWHLMGIIARQQTDCRSLWKTVTFQPRSKRQDSGFKRIFGNLPSNYPHVVSSEAFDRHFLQLYADVGIE